ncbi:MAG TPA: hypothetical protein PKD70_06385 [Saprospiraceae bacterium]|nr:hypothetical protein [Saprospiraceae bacterium]HMP13486.1 hypothetical protein [Saprospiraceae bacterium]
MTKIAYIHGLPRHPPQDEWEERRAQIPTQPFIDYSKLTRGELKVFLLQEQLQMLSAFYPENVQYKSYLQDVEAALDKGLAGIRIYNRAGIDVILAQAKQLTMPAITPQFLSSRVGNIPPYIECVPPAIQMDEGYGPFWVDTGVSQEEYNNCLYRGSLINVINKHWETSSPHLIYNFLEKPGSEPAIIQAKRLNHRLAMEYFSRLTGLSGDNLTLWARNGIIRSQIQVGGLPWQPEEALANFRLSAKAGEKIGFDPVTITALVQLFVAILGAVGATIALIQALRRQEQISLESTLRGIGSPPFGAEKTDYDNFFKEDTSAEKIKWLFPIVGIGLAAFLFTNKN